jgi:hypothetical protein
LTQKGFGGARFPARAAETAAGHFPTSANAMMLITSDRRGLISDYTERFSSARGTGERVVIDGACLSACTLVVHMLSRVCATSKAMLGFHSAWRPTGDRGRVNSLVASQAMLEVYPVELRRWIARRGGLGTRMIFLHGRELAQIVTPCGNTARANARPPALRSMSDRMRLGRS